MKRLQRIARAVVLPGFDLPPASDQSEALIKAINAGDQRAACRLLNAGANPNTRDGQSPVLGVAAYFGQEKTVSTLLAEGVDISAADNDGINALHAAALAGQLPIVKRLLAGGLAVDGRAVVDGMTPLAYAAVRGHLNVIRLLLTRHANPDLPDSGGNTALLHAALRGRSEVVRLLLAHGANVNTASAHGWTPLMAAACEGHLRVVEELLRHGANQDGTTVAGESAATLAAAAGHARITKLLSRTARSQSGR